MGWQNFDKKICESIEKSRGFKPELEQVLVGPSDVIEKMQLLLETTSSCVSPFIQKVGIEAIDGDQTFHKYMHSEYRKEAILLCVSLIQLKVLIVLCPVVHSMFL